MRLSNNQKKNFTIWQLTMLSALSVVSSRDAAKQPSSVEPPSHIPANAAMLLANRRDALVSF